MEPYYLNIDKIDEYLNSLPEEKRKLSIYFWWIERIQKKKEKKLIQTTNKD